MMFIQLLALYSSNMSRNAIKRDFLSNHGQNGVKIQTWVKR